MHKAIKIISNRNKIMLITNAYHKFAIKNEKYQVNISIIQ